MDGLGFSLDNWIGLDWVWVISTLLNGLLGFKSSTHLMPTQTHPNSSIWHPYIIVAACLKSSASIWRGKIVFTLSAKAKTKFPLQSLAIPATTKSFTPTAASQFILISPFTGLTHRTSFFNDGGDRAIYRPSHQGLVFKKSTLWKKNSCTCS